MKNFQLSLIFLVVAIAIMVICADARAAAEEAPKSKEAPKSEESRMKRQLIAGAEPGAPAHFRVRRYDDCTNCVSNCRSVGNNGGSCVGGECICN